MNIDGWKGLDEWGMYDQQIEKEGGGKGKYVLLCT